MSTEAGDESFGDEALDALLEEGVLKGFARMDLALTLAGAFIVLMWGFFTFFHAPNLPFLHQDFARIVENPPLHGVSTISEGWNARTIRPLTALSFAVCWQLGGGSPGMFHFANALLHVLSAAALYLLCRRIFPRDRVSEAVCLAPALVFLVHPAFSAPALYIGSHGVLLGTFFALCTALSYLGPSSATHDARTYDRYLTFAMVGFTLAWGAHAAVWALPLVLAALDLAVFRRVRWRRLAPVAFLAAAFLVVHITTRTAMGESVPGPAGVWHFAGSFGAFVGGFVRFGLPLPEHPLGNATVFGAILWSATLVIGVALSRIAPKIGLALLWTAVLFVAQGLLFPTMLSSDLYLPFAGAVLLLPAAIVTVPAGVARTSAGMAIAAFVIVLSTTTFFHTFAWDDEESLLRETLNACPECDAVQASLTRAYLNRARSAAAAARDAQRPAERQRHLDAALDGYARAVDHLEAVLEREPQNAARWLDLGDAKRALGDREGMTEAYERARAADPWSGEASLRLAKAQLSAAGDAPAQAELARAVDLYMAALKGNALEEEDYARFAQLLTRIGNFEAADEVLRAGIDKTASATLRRLQEQNARSIESLRKREERIGSLSGRDKTYEEAYVLHLRRRFLQSSYVLEADLQENGFEERMWTLLAKNRAAMDQLDVFVEEFQGRGDIPAQAWTRLAREFEESGDTQAAETVLNAVPTRSRNAPTR